MTSPVTLPSIAAAPQASTPDTPISAEREAELRASSREFEAVFVRQMLQYAGLAEAFGSESGQSSEAFSSFLLDHLAEELVDQRSFGLAETFYNRLAASEAATATSEVKRV